MGKKPEKLNEKSTQEIWKRDSEITRSQIFASGTVQKWLELADKAFAKDPKAEDVSETETHQTETSAQSGPQLIKVARAKSA